MKHFVLPIFLVLIIFRQSGYSLITGGESRAPIDDRGWPSGSVTMANLENRIGWWEGPPFGGGEYHFLYRCMNTYEFNEALKSFSKIESKRLELVVHNGPEYSFILKSNDEKLGLPSNQIDWEFTVFIPENWNRLYNNPESLYLSVHPNFRKPVAAPRIDVYIGGGAIIWEHVEVPENIIVIEKRPVSISKKFAGSGLIDAMVLDINTDKAIKGADVIVVKREDRKKLKEIARGKTDESGFCRIGSIPDGYYEVVVKADGYVSRKQGVYNNRRPEYYEFQTKLVHPSYIKGNVFSVKGSPVEGVKIRAADTVGKDGFGYQLEGASFAITDSNGHFEITGLPVGDAYLTCLDPNWHFAAGVKKYEIPSDGVMLIVTGTGVIRGKIIKTNGESPNVEVNMDIEPIGGNKVGTWGWSGNLNDDYKFEITGVPPGDYIISTRPNPSRGNYEPNTQKINIDAGNVYELEIIFAEDKKPDKLGTMLDSGKDLGA